MAFSVITRIKHAEFTVLYVRIFFLQEKIQEVFGVNDLNAKKSTYFCWIDRCFVTILYKTSLNVFFFFTIKLYIPCFSCSILFYYKKTGNRLEVIYNNS